MGGAGWWRTALRLASIESDKGPLAAGLVAGRELCRLWYAGPEERLISPAEMELCEPSSPVEEPFRTRPPLAEPPDVRTPPDIARIGPGDPYPGFS